MLRCYRFDQRPFSLACRVAFAVIAPALLSGCVALSIPSVRYHDPNDRGGILGPHKPADQSSEVAVIGEAAVISGNGGACLDCGDEELEGDKPETPPEVPWPRFHPLPTRPVFSNIQP